MHNFDTATRRATVKRDTVIVKKAPVEPDDAFLSIIKQKGFCHVSSHNATSNLNLSLQSKQREQILSDKYMPVEAL